MYLKSTTIGLTSPKQASTWYTSPIGSLLTDPSIATPNLEREPFSGREDRR